MRSKPVYPWYWWSVLTRIEKVRQDKGPNRPIVPESERAEILCHSGYVDLVYVKGVTDPHWHLIKTLRPEVLQVVDGQYEEADIVELKGLCGDVIVTPKQAETSTTANVRRLMIGVINEIEPRAHALRAKAQDLEQQSEAFSVFLKELAERHT